MVLDCQLRLSALAICKTKSFVCSYLRIVLMNPQTFAPDVAEAVATLRRGGLILYPTDTIWGIGCDATNAEAVAKVFALKQREESKSLITLFDSADRVSRYFDTIPDVAYDLMDVAVNPLTLILDGARGVAANLLAADGSMAVRITSEAFSRELCYRFQKPIVSTSANISGQPAAAVFSEVSPVIINGVDYVVKYRQNDMQRCKPSSIVRLQAGGQVTIIRQ